MKTIESFLNKDIWNELQLPDMQKANYKIKLVGNNGKSNKKLLEDGSYFYLKALSKNCRVKRLKGVPGVHMFLQSISTPVTRWVAITDDPDYTFIDSRY